ncbi:cyclic di-AMP binding protein CbpA [Bombilactobacillus thymidiniphilus]|uniref:Cyclic di-AMP binding protein CbpA n=1 Tax=Bombilactobacillus thymidiniphilus TaxID=2923363 RepID=A0ABY4PEG7_9LACO|nr:cyclic di-AMP binding protein CbpA [Bombilactobacillus thymidiniphilus]UQS84032.1 cyclic di-AMP binding protein CbpA [Bombilactobacillus thymidiniphilus]
MLIKSLVLKKQFLTTVQESVTLGEALTILEDTGFRCVPILDSTGTIFRGNIYKMHIYRHKSRGGDMNLPVTYLLKNATKTIPINAPFFKVFFNIKDLPYIAVLDENNHFYGILTHTKLLNMLSEAWNIDTGSYVLTVISSGQSGELAAMSEIISREVVIAGCLTLDAKKTALVRRNLFTLQSGVTKKQLKKIIKNLEEHNFHVSEVDDLQNGVILNEF